MKCGAGKKRRSPVSGVGRGRGFFPVRSDADAKDEDSALTAPGKTVTMLTPDSVEGGSVGAGRLVREV